MPDLIVGEPPVLEEADVVVGAPFTDANGALAQMQTLAIGDTIDGIIAVAAEVDMEILAIHLKATFEATTTTATTPSVPSLREVEIQVSTQDVFEIPIDAQGIFYRTHMQCRDSELYEDETNGTGGGSGGQLGDVEVWISPEAWRDRTVRNLPAGSPVQLHARVQSAVNQDQQTLRGLLEVYGRELESQRTTGGVTI